MYAGGLSQLVSKYLSTRCWQLRRNAGNLVLPVGDSNHKVADNQFILVCRPGCADITDQLAVLAKTGTAQALVWRAGCDRRWTPPRMPRLLLRRSWLLGLALNRLSAMALQ